MKRLVCLLTSLLLLCGSLSACGGSNHKKVAESFCEAIATGDMNLLKDSCHPSIFPELRSSVLPGIEESGAPADNGKYKINLTEKGACSSQKIHSIEDWYYSELEISLSIDEAYLYQCKIEFADDEGDWGEWEEFSVASAKIDGKWYALPLYE